MDERTTVESLDLPLDENLTELSESEVDKTVKILSIYLTEKKLGLSYYDELTNSLKSDGYDLSLDEMEGILSSLKYSYEPTILLVQPRVVTNKPLLDLVTSGWDGTPEIYSFHVIKNTFWNYENSLRFMCSKLMIKQETPLNQSVESLSYQVPFPSLPYHPHLRKIISDFLQILI
jgi:hypothetical protein